MLEQFKNPDLKYHSKIRYWIPAGMVKEEDLRKDIQDLKKRGFGSIEVVSIMTFQYRQPPKAYRWGSEHWLQAIITILDEAQKLGMKVDIANGPQWPIAMPNIKDADDPATLYELTYGIKTMKELRQDASLPSAVCCHDEGTSELIALMVYREVQEGVLDENSYLNLIDKIEENKLQAEYITDDLHDIVFAFYQQPACHKVEGCYVIDHLSEKGVQACKEYWYKELYPYIKPYQDTLQSIFCDSLEYKVTLEWTREFDKIFEDKKGYDLKPYLPIIGTNKTYPKNEPTGYCFKNTVLNEAINHDYYDVITDLYTDCHLAPLEKMANEMGMNIRYQVAYNKPFEIERAATAVAIPEGEALSRASIDNLKAMAGSAHLTHKKKYSYECSAEFGNGYGQTFEDIFWWIKRSYSAGMNDQVFHGAAYSGGYDGQDNENGCFPTSTWPGYEPFAREISNYWNRTLDVEGMNYHMTMIARYNYILQKQSKVDLAIYRQDYLNDGKGADGNHLLKDQLLLTQYGYTYDFVSPSLLDRAKVTHHCLDEQNVGYKAMIIQEHTGMATMHLQKVLTLIEQGLPVFIIGKLNEDVFFKNDDPISQQQYLQQLNEKAYHVDDFNDLIMALKQMLIEPNAQYSVPSNIFNVCSKDKDYTYYYFYNFNPVKFGLYEDINPNKAIFHPDTIYPTIKKQEVFECKNLEVILKGEGYPVLMDTQTGTLRNIPYQKKEEGIYLQLFMKKDEALLIGLVNDKTYQTITTSDLLHCQKPWFNQFIKDWQVTPYSLKIVDQSRLFRDYQYQKLIANSCNGWLTGNQSFHFDAGYMEYVSNFNVSHDGYYALSFEIIEDTFNIEIDGQKIYSKSEYEPIIELPYLLAGKHHIKVTVYTNLRQMLKDKATYGIFGLVRLLEYDALKTKIKEITKA